MKVHRQCDGRRGGFAVKGFSAIFAGSIHGNGWVLRYGTASWNHAMNAKASSSSTTAYCEHTCPACNPPIHSTTISFVTPPFPYLRCSKQCPLSASPPPIISLLSLFLTSFISHYPLRSFDCAATAGTYLLANPPRQTGSFQWLQRGIRLAQKERNNHDLF